MKGEDVTLDIQGDDMANLYPLIRLVFPSTPPYRLKGHLKHDGKVWSFSNFSGRVGDSDLSGNIRVDTAPKRPFMKADLVSNLLDFDDLAGFIGGKPGTAPGETASEEQKKQAAAEKDSDRIFPDQRYDLERLRAMDADVRLRAKKILAPKLPIDDLNATIKLERRSFALLAGGIRRRQRPHGDLQHLRRIETALEGEDRCAAPAPGFETIPRRQFIRTKNPQPYWRANRSCGDRRILSRTHGDCLRQHLLRHVGRRDQRVAHSVGWTRRCSCLGRGHSGR